MKLRTASIILSVLLLGLFSVLSFSFIKTSDLLDFQAQEIASAGESIRVAQGLKVRLLAHNRNSFLYSLHKNPLHHETRHTQRKEIGELLSSAESHLDSNEEQAILAKAKEEIASYLKRRDNLETKAISPQARYNLVSLDVDHAISAIDKLVAINRSQMNDLSEKTRKINEDANRLAIFILVFGGMVLLGVIISIFTFVTHPLGGIAHVIARYSAGETSTRITKKGLAEIQKIGSNFNSMAQSLEEKRQDQMRFIASIAHDLRNPLSSMSMAAELLVSQGQNEDQELSKIIFRQTQSLDRLVGDLLDTTRIEAGQLDLDLSKQDINSLVKDSVELRRTGSDLHAFKLELSDEALVCKCDGGRLSQVMNNLLSNAVKYSPNGGSVVVKSWSEGGEAIKISVTDQGIGIDPQDLENIFKPFHRTKATKGTIPGIGLGLSASRRIIESHGGSLKVESFPGKGSTFCITLPLYMGVQRATGPEEKVGKNGTPSADA